MSKIIKGFLSLLMAFSVMVVHFDQEVQTVDAQNGCDAYELAWVNDTGGFDTVACYSTFSEANQAMTDKDYVIRHASSKSPTKIIAIASGIAYSYPRRNGSTTLNVYQHPDHITEKEKYKSTYVVQHRELFQPETISYNGNGEGNVKVVLNGFEGYASLSSLDLIPMKMIEKGFSITIGGQTNDGGIPEEPFSLIPQISSYTVVQNGNYRDLVYTYYSGYNGAPSRLTIGPAADWMITGQVYYSKDGYQFYSNPEMTEYLASYYSYYLFLPFRSESNISGDVLDAYISSKGYTEKPAGTSTNNLKENQSQMVNEGNTFTQAQHIYGVNALLTYAMAWNESGAGRSTYAVSKNNLFGWAAIDSNPDNASQFSSISAGIQEHMAYNLRGYMDISDVRYFGMHLGTKANGFNVKYASDPYWGFKIAAIAYDIDKFSKNYDGTLSDCNTYRLGVIDEFGASFYQSASKKSDVLMTSQYSSQYQNNHIVVVKDETDDFYQVQSPNGLQLVNDQLQLVYHKLNGEVQPAIAYSFDLSIGYVNRDSITLLNEINDATIEGQTPEGDFVFELEEFQIDEDGLLHISGSSYRPGIYLTEKNQLIHTLVVFNNTYERMTESRLSSELVENTKDQVQFTGTLDLNELKDGTYYFRFNSDYSMTDQYSDTRVLKNEVENVETLYAAYTFTVQDDVLWLTVESKPVLNPDDYVLISSLKSIEFVDNILTLKGISLIRDLPHSQEKVKHELVATNLQTNEDIVVAELKSSSGDYNLNEVYEDGFDYEFGWYEDSVNIGDLPLGNYVLKVRTTTEGLSKESKLYGTSKMKESNTYLSEDGLYRQLVMKYAMSYRAEISVMPYALEKTVKNPLPRIREGYQNLISMVMDTEKKIITVSGSSFIYNAMFDETSEVKYTMHALNRTDGSMYSFVAQGSNLLMNEEPPWDNTARMNSEFNYDYTWYDIVMPLTGMTDGEYDFILQVETKDYVEYIDVKKSSISGLKSHSYSDENFVNISIDRNNKNKVMMNLKGFAE